MLHGCIKISLTRMPPRSTVLCSSIFTVWRNSLPVKALQLSFPASSYIHQNLTKTTYRWDYCNRKFFYDHNSSIFTTSNCDKGIKEITCSFGSVGVEWRYRQLDVTCYRLSKQRNENLCEAKRPCSINLLAGRWFNILSSVLLTVLPFWSHVLTALFSWWNTIYRPVLQKIRGRRWQIN